MKAIRFQNEVYAPVTAGHKKCEDGTHWNDAKHKCLKLPPKTLEKHKTALSLSAKAHKATADAQGSKSLDAHHEAYKAHRAADKAHEEAAKSAWHNGFDSLGNKHNLQTTKHDSIAEKHAKHVAKHFKDHLVV
jgi:hypothetical protein